MRSLFMSVYLHVCVCVCVIALYCISTRTHYTICIGLGGSVNTMDVPERVCGECEHTHTHRRCEWPDGHGKRILMVNSMSSGGGGAIERVIRESVRCFYMIYCGYFPICELNVWGRDCGFIDPNAFRKHRTTAI